MTRAAPSRPFNGSVVLWAMLGSMLLGSWGLRWDIQWHQRIGRDSFWIAPHLMTYAREVYPAGSRGKLAATLVAAAMFYGNLRIVASPAFEFAQGQGGVAFHAYAILGALLFPLALIPAVSLTGLRVGPLLVWLVAVLLRLSGELVAAVGFRLTQPVSVIPAGTANTSAWAVADSGMVLVAPLVPILVLVVLDLGRRPLLASLAHGVTLFALVAWIETISPSLGPMTPGIGATLIALALTGVAALAGAVAGRWLGGILLGLS